MSEQTTINKFQQIPEPDDRQAHSSLERPTIDNVLDSVEEHYTAKGYRISDQSTSFKEKTGTNQYRRRFTDGRFTFQIAYNGIGGNRLLMGKDEKVSAYIGSYFEFEVSVKVPIDPEKYPKILDEFNQEFIQALEEKGIIASQERRTVGENQIGRSKALRGMVTTILYVQQEPIAVYGNWNGHASTFRKAFKEGLEKLLSEVVDAFIMTRLQVYDEKKHGQYAPEQPKSRSAFF